MRYQSALVLSTLAVGQAAAAGNLRHASFHARRSAGLPGPESVAWNNVVRDTVDYKAATDKITQAEWDAIFAAQNNQPPAASTPAPAPSAAPAPPANNAGEPKPSKAADPAPAKPSKAPSSGNGGNVLQALGCSAGENSESPNESVWVGNSGSKTQMTFTNDADEDSAVLCWSKDGMFTTKTAPIIAKHVGAGESLTLSIAPGFSGGCGAAYADSKFHMSGILDESILEFTTAPKNPGQWDFGAYDISREVNMNGIIISATGDRQCTSGVKNGGLSCAFGCTDGATSCEKTGTYNIIAGVETSEYCMSKGKDQQTGGASGGCQFNRDGDHLKVTYSKDRNWPAATF